MLPEAWQPRVRWPTTSHHQGQARQFLAHAPLDFRLGRGVVHQLLLRRREFPGLADRRLSLRSAAHRGTDVEETLQSLRTAQHVGEGESAVDVDRPDGRVLRERRHGGAIDHPLHLHQARRLAGQPGGVEEIAAEDLLRPQCQAVGFVDAMHQQVAAQAFEPLLAGFGADQEGQVGAVPGGDQLGGDRTAEKAGGPRQQDAFAGIDSGDLLTVGMHVHVFPPQRSQSPTPRCEGGCAAAYEGMP